MIILNKEKVLSRAQESQMENRISLGGGLVGSMEFVVARPDREAIVGRIISILEKRDVPKKELQACKIAKKGGQKDKLVLLQLFEKPSPTTRRPNPQECGNIPDSLLEVIESCKLMWMEAKKIDTIAYIFHIDQVQKGTIFVHGIMDCYFIRNEIRCHYKKSANGLVPNNKSSKLKLKDFQSFQNPYRDGESYSQRMYTLIATANEMVSAALRSGGQWNGSTRSVTLKGVGEEFYQYILSKLLETPQFILWNKTQSRKIMLPDLSVTNARMKVKTQGFRIMKEDELTALRLVLGASFAISPRIAAPSRKSIKAGGPTTRRLRHGDMVRAVTCQREDYGSSFETNPLRREPHQVSSNRLNDEARSPNPKRQKVRCPYPGLDVLFIKCENQVTAVTFTLRFVKVLATASCVRKAQVGGALEVDVNEEEGGAPSNVAVGDIFEYEETLYQVVTIDEESNSATIENAEDDQASRRTITHQLARQLHTQYTNEN